MIRVGVVGLGFMGSTHLQAWKGVSGAEVVAVVSSDPKKRTGDLSNVGGNLGTESGFVDLSQCALYTRTEDLLADRSVDAVDLCVPTHLHTPLALEAFEAGKDVLVEKPMALTPEECNRMILAAEEYERVLMVAQVIRFWPDYREARTRILDGEIGTLDLASFRRRCAAPAWNPWLHDPTVSGGGAFDLLIHDFDFCIHLLGMPHRVKAVGVHHPDAGIDLLEASLEYREGPIVQVSGGWYPGDYPFSMEFTLTGNRGTFEFRSGSQRLTLYRPGTAAHESGFGQDDGFQDELQAFATACVERRLPELCPPRESAQAVSLTLAALDSRDRGGEPITI